MNPGNFFIPNNPSMGMNLVSPMMMRMNQMTPRSIGLFGRIGRGIKSFNWSGLLNGANKTLNVMNQTIPLIRQAKPMVNNMKSMVKLARAFGSETLSKNNNFNRHVNTKLANSKDVSNSNVIDKTDKIANIKTNNVSNNNYPNFFI